MLAERSGYGLYQLPAQGSIEAVSRRDELNQVRHLPEPDVNSPLCYRLDEAWHRWYSSALGQHLVHGLQGQTHIYCSDRNTDWDSKRPESFFKLYWNVIVDLKQKTKNNNQKHVKNGKIQS